MLYLLAFLINANSFPSLLTCILLIPNAKYPIQSLFSLIKLLHIPKYPMFFYVFFHYFYYCTPIPTMAFVLFGFVLHPMGFVCFFTTIKTFGAGPGNTRFLCSFGRKTIALVLNVSSSVLW